MTHKGLLRLVIDDLPLLVDEGRYRYDDVTYFSNQQHTGTPDFTDVMPEDLFVQNDWSGGAGLRNWKPSSAENDRYVWSSNIDLSFPNVAFLSPARNTMKLTSGVAPTISMSNLDQMIMVRWDTSIFFFCGTKGFYWDTSAATLPNVLTTTGPTGATTFPAAVTSAVVYNGVLCVAVGTSNKYFYTTDKTPAVAGDWTQSTNADGYAEYFTVLQGILYKGASATGSRSTCDVKSTTNPVNASTWTLSGNVGTIDVPMTNLVTFNNNLVIFKEDGIYLFDLSGVAYEAVPALKQFQHQMNGKYATEHDGVLYFRLGRSTAQWAGGGSLNVAASSGLKSIGGSNRYQTFTPTTGYPTAILAHPPFLYIATSSTRTANQYSAIHKYIAQPPTPTERGLHDWLTINATRIQGLGLYSDAAPSPDGVAYLFIGVTAALYYVKMPRFSSYPIVDVDWAYDFYSTGYFDTSWISFGPENVPKVLVSLDLQADQLSGTNYIEVYYGINGAAPSVLLGTLTTSGFTTLYFPTGDSTVECYNVAFRFSFVGSSAANTPILYLFGLSGHNVYRTLRQWILTVPAGEYVDLQRQITPKTMEGYLTTLRNEHKAVPFKDHLGDEYTVMVQRLSRQGSGGTVAGSPSNLEPEMYFEVQLIEWPTA